MMRNCGKQRDRDGDILLVRNIDACIHVCKMYTRGTVPVFTIHCTRLYRRIRFEDQLDHNSTRMKAARAKSVFQALAPAAWYKLPSGAVASVCGS